MILIFVIVIMIIINYAYQAMTTEFTAKERKILRIAGFYFFGIIFLGIIECCWYLFG